MTSIPSERIPRPVFELAEQLERSGERAWIVGGCLRDLLLGRTVSDWDLATTATPDRITRIFQRTIPTGIAHGTVTVMHRGVGYEVTTLRGEGAYSDGRHPDSVFFVDDITRDLERRDFTVNAIAYELATSTLVDPFDGRADLERRVIRAVRDPMLRFSEDGLRVLRAARFSASLGFAIDPATQAAIRPTLGVLAKVSRERVRDEWMKTMKAERPSPAFEVMRSTGILDTVAPPLGATQSDEFEAALVAVDCAKDILVRHAALLAAIGTDVAAAAKATSVLHELRYSTDEKRLVSALVENANPPPRRTVDRVEARRILRRVGRARLDSWLELLRARTAAREPSDVAAWESSRQQEQRDGMIFEVKDLAIRGDQIAPLVGGPGPAIKRVLESLVAFVEQDPSQNQPDSLIAEATRVARSRQVDA